MTTTAYDTLIRQVYTWIDKARRETAIDPNPEFFELVMHPDTWRAVLQTVSLYALPGLVADVDKKLLGMWVRLDPELPVGQVKLRCIWETML